MTKLEPIREFTSDDGKGVFRCPENMAHHCAKVLVGEYDVPINFPEPPTILDIGANVGAFSVWALGRWPGCRIMAYEPSPEAVSLLRENVEAHGVEVHPVAVRALGGMAAMRAGKNNLGEASFHELGEQAGDQFAVQCVEASTLPRVDIIKIDTEGCEMEILANLTYTNVARAILVEFHRESDRKSIDRLLGPVFSLWRANITTSDRGVLRYVRTSA